MNFITQPGTETHSTAGSRRMLATILFTDIVDSTLQAREMGDKAWRELLQAHDATVRREMARFRGSEVKSLGDGFLILFDGPARAIHCAQAITEAMAPLGIKVRVGLHTGEVERLCAITALALPPRAEGAIHLGSPNTVSLPHRTGRADLRHPALRLVSP